MRAREAAPSHIATRLIRPGRPAQEAAEDSLSRHFVDSFATFEPSKNPPSNQLVGPLPTRKASDHDFHVLLSSRRSFPVVADDEGPSNVVGVQLRSPLTGSHNPSGASSATVAFGLSTSVLGFGSCNPRLDGGSQHRLNDLRFAQRLQPTLEPASNNFCI